MKKIILAIVCFAVLALSPTGNKFKTPKDFVFIPASIDKVGEHEYSVQAFFMANHEVTNAEYRQFLNSLKASGQESLYKASYPDTNAWNNIGGFLEPMANTYFWHPAYDNYPVVNITPAGATLYCQWLTSEFKTKYGDHINPVRLPTKYEWIVAAKAGRQDAIYPWGTTQVRSSDGSYMANFVVAGEQNIRSTAAGLIVVQDSSATPNLLAADNAFFTATATSFPQNDFGLYHMSGNVAELTHEGPAMGGH